MTKISVNVNKLATLRNSRGGNLPNVVEVAKDCLQFGAHGITVHPRPDGRHIRYQDVADLKMMIDHFNQDHLSKKREFNIEGYPSESFLNLIQQVKPDQVTLVPDPPEVLTSNAGWKVQLYQDFLKNIVSLIKSEKIRVSLFIDPLDVDEAFLLHLKNISPHRLELYTEKYACHFHSPQEKQTLAVYQKAAEKISAYGFELNAGHDLNLKNLASLIEQIPIIKEVSIGHALFCESIYMGLENTISAYLKILSLSTNKSENY